MPTVTLELTARADSAAKPIIWRIARSFNVVTNVLRARITHDYAFVALTIEGSKSEVDQAVGYLKSLGIVKGSDASGQDILRPEATIPQPNAISVRLSTVTAGQAHSPILYRICKDFNVVVNMERAAFDEEDGGTVDVVLSGPLSEVQRAIAYLHTTGIHVNPRQRSVTDFSNL